MLLDPPLSCSVLILSSQLAERFKAAVHDQKGHLRFVASRYKTRWGSIYRFAILLLKLVKCKRLRRSAAHEEAQASPKAIASAVIEKHVSSKIPTL